MDNGRIMKELKELQEAVKNVFTLPPLSNHYLYRALDPLSKLSW